jgi:hypothetical protein
VHGNPSQVPGIYNRTNRGETHTVKTYKQTNMHTWKTKLTHKISKTNNIIHTHGNTLQVPVTGNRTNRGEAHTLKTWKQLQFQCSENAQHKSTAVCPCEKNKVKMATQISRPQT